MMPPTIDAALRQMMPPVFAPMRAAIDRYHFTPPPGHALEIRHLHQRRVALRRIDAQLIVQSLEHINEALALLGGLT